MSHLPEERADPRIGTTVAGRFYLHRRLGQGGAGTVYRATELGPERLVALKLFDQEGVDDAARARFEREVTAASKLLDPSCIEILDAGRTDGGLGWIAMELVDGRDLARVLDQEGPLAPGRAAHVADRILALLAEAHAAGIVHRDLKPANVMLAPDPAGGPERVKVLDFGIAALVGADERALTAPGVVFGTPAYMSPEQIRGEPVDGRADLYAVGVMLYEMLVGAPPFDGPTPLAVVARQLAEPAPHLDARAPGLPPALTTLVAIALERDRELRPSGAEAMRAALAASLEGAPVTAQAPARSAPAPTTRFVTAVARPPAFARGRRWVLPLASLALTAAAAGLLLAGTAGSAPAGQAGAPSPAVATPVLVPPAHSVPAAQPAPAPSGVTAREPAPPRARTGARRGSGPPPAAAETGTAVALPPASLVIRAVRGELNALPTPAAETGEALLVLQALPWAEVSVDGEPLGETPREVRLAAGPHEVRAVHPELGVRAERIVVPAGARTLWVARFRE